MNPSPKLSPLSKNLPTRTKRRGIALVIVMVVVMLVALAAYGFNQQMTDAYRIGSTEIEQTQARLAMSSGIEFGLAIAELPRAQRAAWLTSNPNAFYLVPVDAADGDVDPEEAMWTFSILRPSSDPDSETPFAAGWVDESSKLNLWTLLLQNQQFPGHARKALLNLPGADSTTVDALLAPFLQSANNTSSLQDRLPNESDPQAQQRRLAQLWTGLDWDQNYQVDPLEFALAASANDNSIPTDGPARSVDNYLASNAGAETPMLPWRDLVTLSSGSRNENRLGQPRIHLNDSNLSRLQRRLDAIWDSERSRFVIAALQYGLQPQPQPQPSNTITSSSSSSNTDAIAPPTWTPDLAVPFANRLSSPLDMVDAVVRVPHAQEQPLVLLSPFSSANPSWSDYLDALLDDTTLFPGPMIHGQVNINQAPLAVLLGIPEMSSEMATKIIRQREQRPRSNTDFHSVSWLLTENVLSLAEAKTILPWINSGGDCFTAQVVGQLDNNSPTHRCSVTLDARQQPATAHQVQLWHPWSPLRLQSDLLPTNLSPTSR